MPHSLEPEMGNKTHSSLARWDRDSMPCIIKFDFSVHYISSISQNDNYYLYLLYLTHLNP